MGELREEYGNLSKGMLMAVNVPGNVMFCPVFKLLVYASYSSFKSENVRVCER